MPREKETYRAHLTALREQHPQSETITLADAARYIGCDPRTLRKIAKFPQMKMGRYTRVSIINLASWLAANVKEKE